MDEICAECLGYDTGERYEEGSRMEERHQRRKDLGNVSSGLKL